MASDSFIQLPADGAGKKTRTYVNTISGNDVHVQWVAPTDPRSATSCVAVSPRIVGSASSVQNLFVLTNQVGSGILIDLDVLSIEMDSTGAVTHMSPNFLFTRQPTQPTGGTTAAKQVYDTSIQSNPKVVCLMGASADGTSGQVIVALPSVSAIGRIFGTRNHTAVGYINSPAEQLIPPVITLDKNIILRENESIMVSVSALNVLSNSSNNNYVIICKWDELRQN